MKLHEVLPIEQLDETSLKHALAAGILGTSMAMPGAMSDGKPPTPTYDAPRDEIVSTARRYEPPKQEIDIPAPTFAKRAKLARNIAKNYRINRDLAQRVVDLAFKYEDEQFPKAEDILAVIGIESSFDPESVSNLRRDPARGLMQVRPGVWNLDPDSLGNIESQIKYGVEILKRYYKKTGNREDALHAYNIGITRFRKGGRNPTYVAKYQREVDRLD